MNQITLNPHRVETMSWQQAHGAVHPPVVSDAVKEAVALMHHGSHGAQDGGVAHQTGRQHKVTAATAADTDKS